MGGGGGGGIVTIIIYVAVEGPELDRVPFEEVL